MQQALCAVISGSTFSRFAVQLQIIFLSYQTIRSEVNCGIL